MKDFKKLKDGYQKFQQQYASGATSMMQDLAIKGQKPFALVVGCCDSRVDPAVIFNTGPGELFTIRNVANIVPPYDADEKHHGTSAALEFGICYLNIKHLIILGHSQCGGLNALMHQENLHQNDFITSWVTIIKKSGETDVDVLAQNALLQSHANCLTFPWIKSRVEAEELHIHLWFFDIKKGVILAYENVDKRFAALA